MVCLIFFEIVETVGIVTGLIQLTDFFGGVIQTDDKSAIARLGELLMIVLPFAVNAGI